MRRRMMQHENTIQRRELERVRREGMVAGNSGELVKDDEDNPYFAGTAVDGTTWWKEFRKELNWSIGQSHGYDLHKAGINIQPTQGLTTS